MNTIPVLLSPRLRLRGFELSDAEEVRRLAGDREVAATTLMIPHPYEPGMAEQWIGTHQSQFESGKEVVWAITQRESGELMGAIGVRVDREHERGSIGYWIGRPYWKQGYCTEAAREVVRHGFNQMGLERIDAWYFGNNPASGRVMQKIGMLYEGTQPKRCKKWGEFIDGILYGMDRQRFAAFEERRDRQMSWEILGIDHVQLTVPAGHEEQARKFYCELLGLREVEKPDSLKSRGGLWLQVGDRQVHIGTEAGVDRRATKAHIAYRVNELEPWRRILSENGVEILDSVPIPGYERFEFRDPFGNRVEMICQAVQR